MTHTYTITGMTCGGCVAKVKSELLKTANITDAVVQLQSPQATITMDRHVPLPVLQSVIAKAGNYTITEEAGDMHVQAKATEHPVDESEKTSYYPVFLLFGYITGVTLLIQWSQGAFHWMQWMQHFMAGFFLVFSFFKLMNLSGFAEGYGTYDIVAKRIPAWGFIYPFVELALGVAFLTGLEMLAVNWVAFIVMGVSSISVIQSLVSKRQFQCACLGTVFKLPLSKVTLVEDLLMVAMSGGTIVWMML